MKFLRLLAGCSFPREQFPLCGYTVVRMRPEEIEKLGAPADACRDFYQAERLNTTSSLWFLQEEIKADQGLIDCGPEESAPTPAANLVVESESVPVPSRQTITVSRAPGADWPHYRLPGFGGHLKPLLTLALFSNEFFDVPLALIADPGWRIWKLVAPERRLNGLPYSVSEKNWAQFECFGGDCAQAFKKLEEPCFANRGKLEYSGLSLAIAVAARHYLHATFAGVRRVPGFLIEPPFADPLLMGDYWESNFEESSIDWGFVVDDVFLRYILRTRDRFRGP
jgi:hypothetical protein